MNRFCERCERITQDGNLWCQDKDCPAEEGFPVLTYGDYLGDLKITKLVRVWRTAALYEAERGAEPVWVKVAHAGEDCEERLKREALALEALAPRTLPFQSYFPQPRSVLPVPLSPYPTPSKRPFGEISFRGETKVFSVFKINKGKILSDLLLENPQLWHYEAAWIIITLAEALRPLAAKNKCHLSLTPEVVLVDVDPDRHYRPMLLDLGFIIEGNEIEGFGDFPKLCEPAYTAPELLAGKRLKTVTPAADAYSLGMMLYEMLAGKPGWEPKLYRDEKVREGVVQNRTPLAVGRPELQQAGVVKIVERAIAPAGRFNHIIELSDALAKIYSAPPPEKRPVPQRTYVLASLIGLIFLIAVGVAGFFLVRMLTG